MELGNSSLQEILFQPVNIAHHLGISPKQASEKSLLLVYKSRNETYGWSSGREGV